MGSQLHYLEGAGSGQTVVLLHGKAFQAETWRETGTLDQLIGHDYHCLAPDMPGFGRSPRADLDLVEALAGFLRETGVQRPVLVGPSMGGAVVLEYLLSRQADLAGLVLVGAVRIVENQDRLAQISVPTLLVWGSEDTISPLSNCTLLEQEIAGARAVVIEGAPHPCYLDQPERFNAALTTFLGALAG